MLYIWIRFRNEKNLIKKELYYFSILFYRDRWLNATIKQLTLYLQLIEKSENGYMKTAMKKKERKT